MSGLRPGVPLAEVTRCVRGCVADPVESLHTGHLVVTDADGTVRAGLGDRHVPVFVRSAVKPLQAAACLELLADAGATRPSPPELAVASASHCGAPRHLDAVRALLERAGVDPEQLTCPPATATADPGAAPTRLQHNCSGKHAMFALAGGMLGLSGPALLDADGPLQRRVLATLDTDLGGLTGVGVDGCGAPAVVAPLSGLATAFARFVGEPRFEPVRDAVLAHPGLVGCEGRLESALLGAGVVAKPGAEGVYGVAWRDSAGEPHGLAVKASDGSGRGVAAALSTLLEDIEVVAPGIWSAPPPLGGGDPVGEVRASAAVRDLGQQAALRAVAPG